MKAKAILFVLFIGLLTLSGCKTMQSSPLTLLNGKWVGEAYQYNIDGAWEMTFYNNKKGEKYIIQYPLLGCGGEWILERYDGNTFEFREILSEGFDICTDRGKVKLVLKDQDTIAFFYYWPYDEVLTASGYLHRSM